MIRIYIAGSWQDRKDVAKLAELLEEGGNFEVTEHWWKHKSRDKWSDYAQGDFKAINLSEFFVLYNGEKTTAGKYVEMGMAIQLGIPILVLRNKMTTVFRYFIDKEVQDMSLDKYVDVIKNFCLYREAE